VSVEALALTPEQHSGRVLGGPAFIEKEPWLALGAETRVEGS
jgi:hypothetical protein